MTVLLLVAVACDALPRHPERGTFEIDILALGDSYTAGNGAIGPQEGAGYFHFSEDDPRDTPELQSTIRYKEWHFSLPDPHPYGCFRNHNNYSTQLYDLLDSSGAYVNGACSGDTTANITAAAPPEAQLAGFDQAQRDEFDLITLHIGGNDLNFGEIARQCFVGFTRKATDCNSNFIAAESQLADNSLYNDMKTALWRVASDLPKAKIVLVGYPLFWEGDFTLSDSSTSLNPTERLRSGLEELNQQQNNAVNELNTQFQGRLAFLPLHQSGGQGFFDGHGIDGGPATDWINEPETVFEADFREEWLHPNTLGHQAIAEELAELPIIQDLRPRGVISKVDGQWYALDQEGVLWKVTPDFVKCHLPAEFYGYELASYENPDQMFLAATNNSPYADMTGQPGCDLSQPRIGDMLSVSPDGVTPSHYQIIPNNGGPGHVPGTLSTRYACTDLTCLGWDGNYHIGTYQCSMQRGAQEFSVTSLGEGGYWPSEPQYFDDSCGYGQHLAWDTHGQLWLTEFVWNPELGLHIRYRPVVGWMVDCLTAAEPPGFIEPPLPDEWAFIQDSDLNTAGRNGQITYQPYTDARCI